MIDPEKKLWQSVLLTAVNDALIKNKTNYVYTKRIAEEAQKWLLNNESNYFKVCSMANINPLSLREKVKEVLSYKTEEAHTMVENMLGENSNILSSMDSDL